MLIGGSTSGKCVSGYRSPSDTPAQPTSLEFWRCDHTSLKLMHPVLLATSAVSLIHVKGVTERQKQFLTCFRQVWLIKRKSGRIKIICLDSWLRWQNHSQSGVSSISQGLRWSQRVQVQKTGKWASSGRDAWTRRVWMLKIQKDYVFGGSREGYRHKGNHCFWMTNSPLSRIL